MPLLLRLQELQGKCDGGWKKVYLRCFLADQSAFLGILEHTLWQAHSDYGPSTVPVQLTL